MSKSRQSSADTGERRRQREVKRECLCFWWLKQRRSTKSPVFLPQALNVMLTFNVLNMLTNANIILGNYDLPVGCVSLNGIIQLIWVWPVSVKLHLNHDWQNCVELISTEAELKSGNNQLVGNMRNSPENTLTPLEPTAPQDWIQVPNPRRQLPPSPSFFFHTVERSSHGVSKGAERLLWLTPAGRYKYKKKTGAAIVSLYCSSLSQATLSCRLMSSLMQAEGFCRHQTIR